MKTWPLVRELGEMYCGSPSTRLSLPLKKQKGSIFHMVLCHSPAKMGVRLGVNSWASADPTVTNFSISLVSNIFIECRSFSYTL